MGGCRFCGWGKKGGLESVPVRSVRAVLAPRAGEAQRVGGVKKQGLGNRD